jgi:23S rRNA pseudouridine1911/1915/1917 synthase
MSEKFVCPGHLELLNALITLFPSSSKTTLRSWINSGRVFVDGIQVKSVKYVVAQGQAISIGQKTRLVENTFPILYSDDSLVVIDKPAGLLSVSTAFEKTETAFAYLKRKYHPRMVYVVHRLDQETSGVMVFALSEKCLEKLKKTFEKHAIERRYTAIVEGIPTPKKGTWQSYLYDDPNYVVRVTNDAEEGELAITHYRVKVTHRALSWIDCTLETGKKNQIRVHCQQAGHPIVGDKKYGSTCNPLKRLGLHAHTLAFEHPMTGKAMHFTSPIPESFYKLLHLSKEMA